MNTFEFVTATTVDGAIREARISSTAQQGATVRFAAGGTTLLDLMKLGVEAPTKLVAIHRLPLKEVERTPDGGLRIGALVTNATLARHPVVMGEYQVLAQAILSGASAQLRNMATTAGNLLQRTRCMYFRNVHLPCNKRQPGSGCPAVEGENRNLAIFGGSEYCIATNPSDMNVALAALDAHVVIEGRAGKQSVSVLDFHLLPGSTPHVESVLEPGDVVTHVVLPPPLPQARHVYLKLRDRASYEFALASAAVVAYTSANGLTYRIAMGGVGTKPWRLAESERQLLNRGPSRAAFQQVADVAFREAKSQSRNGFKVELGKRCLVHALVQATSSEESSTG